MAKTKKHQKAPNLVGDLMKKYALSVRKLAALLGVHPSSIVHWQTARNDIAPKNAELLTLLDLKISEISKNDEITPEQTLEILLAFAKTPLWRGIKSSPGSFHSDPAAIRGADLIEIIKTNLEKVEKGLRPINFETKPALDNRWYDIACQDRHGTLTFIEVKSSIANENILGSLLSYLAETKAITKKEIRIILIAPDFTPGLIKAVSQLPSVILKKMKVTTDVKFFDE